MTVESRWDAIVVGSGIGGLVAGGYLAASGLKVVVLEQHDVAGGNSHVFRRRRAYEFDVGIHYLGDCGKGGMLPSILAGLGVADRVRFRRLDPDGFDRIVLPSVTLDVPAGWTRYRDRLIQALPEEATGLTEFIEVCSTVAEANRARLLDPARADVTNLSPQVRRWIHRPLSKLFDHCGLSPRARTLLAAQSGNYGTAPAQALVVMHAGMLDDYMRGTYYPEGGGQRLVASLVEALEAHGGELWTRCRAEEIETSGGRVTGVRLDDGRRLTAPVVVSNVDYRRLVLELTSGAFGRREAARAGEATMRFAMGSTYVALNGEAPDQPNSNLWFWPTEDIEQAYARLAAGDSDEPPFVFMSFASRKDHGTASVCPPGHANFQVITLCPPGYEPWGVSEGPVAGEKYRRNPAYQRAKKRFTDQLVDMAEAALGPFRDRITHLETATPLTHERYVRSTGGTPFGMAVWGPAGRQPDITTPVDGLYVAGQNTRYGPGIVSVAVSGLACASAILDRELLPEVYRGGVLGDPARLPERGPGWDPLEISRGASRRNARGLARIG